MFDTMAQEEEKIDKIISEDVSLDKKKFSLKPKIFIIGLPIFIIQLVAVYFITANVLLSRMKSQQAENIKNKNGKTVPVVNNKSREIGKYLYTVSDIIVNPASTDGKRLLLASLGFDLGSENAISELKTRDVVVRDIIISTLSSKNLVQLSQSSYRDSLKIEITQKMKRTMPDIKVNNVYFSKFIIQ